MASVWWPASFIATERGTPVRSMLRTAVRRKSCGIRPGTPAFLHAKRQTWRNHLIGRPFRWKTQGMIRPVRRWSASVLARCASSAGPELGGHDEGPPLPVLRRPGLESNRARLEVEPPPLKRQDLAPRPPAGDIGERHHAS